MHSLYAENLSIYYVGTYNLPVCSGLLLTGHSNDKNLRRPLLEDLTCMCNKCFS